MVAAIIGVSDQAAFSIWRSGTRPACASATQPQNGMERTNSSTAKFSRDRPSDLLVYMILQLLSKLGFGECSGLIFRSCSLMIVQASVIDLRKCPASRFPWDDPDRTRYRHDRSKMLIWRPWR